MKTQKEAVALRLQIDELRARQEDQRRKARNQEMEREGIPTSGQVLHTFCLRHTYI